MPYVLIIKTRLLILFLNNFMTDPLPNFITNPLYITPFLSSLIPTLPLLQPPLDILLLQMFIYVFSNEFTGNVELLMIILKVLEVYI